MNTATLQPTTYGQAARQLRLSAFFRTPAVWAAIGDNSAYLIWLRQQACARCHQSSQLTSTISSCPLGPSSAVAILYGAIPLCLLCYQHTDPQRNHAWRNQQRLHYVRRWAWQTLKQQLGYSNWRDVPPVVLRAWAERHQLSHYLPAIYHHTPPGDPHE